MTISIITVCYNSDKYIRTAFDAVLYQSYADLEYIVVDGASMDSTVSIIKEYEPLFKGKMKWISEPDRGLYDAMNKGIKMATGEVVGILNSDDLYLNSKVLCSVMEVFANDPRLDMVYGDLLYVKQDDVDKIVRKWISTPYYKGFFEHGNVPPHPALFLRKQVYQNAGLFNLEYKLAADYEFMFRIFNKFQFKSFYLNSVLVKMRLGGATNKSFKNIFDGNREILQAWTDNGKKAPLTLMPRRVLKRLKQFLV